MHCCFHRRYCHKTYIGCATCQYTLNLQDGIKWHPVALVLLRVFYALVPIICIVILQNFYIQSAIFAKQSATTRGTELRAGEEEDEEGKKIHGEEALWISRMVCSAATAVVHFRTI